LASLAEFLAIWQLCCLFENASFNKTIQNMMRIISNINWYTYMPGMFGSSPSVTCSATLCTKTTRRNLTDVPSLPRGMYRFRGQAQLSFLF
jgi:hypothetical protein